MIDLSQRMLAWTWDINGVQVYDDDGGMPRKWLATGVLCTQCGEFWAVAVRLHSYGFECPFCGHLDIEWRWSA